MDVQAQRQAEREARRAAIGYNGVEPQAEEPVEDTVVEETPSDVVEEPKPKRRTKR